MSKKYRVRELRDEILIGLVALAVPFIALSSMTLPL